MILKISEFTDSFTFLPYHLSQLINDDFLVTTFMTSLINIVWKKPKIIN